MAYLTDIRDLIVEYFTLEDLRDLCFELNIDYEQIAGDTKGGKIRELLLFCQRNGRLEMLLDRCRQLRPHVDWQVATTETTAQANELPQLFAQADFEVKIGLVKDRLRRLLTKSTGAQESVLITELLSELRALFNRNTFDEAIEKCEDQNWHDRFCAAVQSDYFLLICWAYVKDSARERGQPQWLQSYEQVQQEVRGYCQALTGFFKPSVTVATVNRHFLRGQLETIRSRLKETRVFREQGLDTKLMARCEKHRLAIRQQVDTWPVL